MNRTILVAQNSGRVKAQLSCDFCRKRKLRCDRKQPCDSCLRLGQVLTCTIPTLKGVRTHADRPPIDPDVRRRLQERIDGLESLVRSLSRKLLGKDVSSTRNSSSLTGHAPRDKDHTPSHQFGHMRLGVSESSYVGNDHWEAILDEIEDLKDVVNDQRYGISVTERDLSRPPGTDLFFCYANPASKLEIIAALPPRIVVDSLVAKYLNSADMPATLIVHRTVFLKQYEQFWKDPLETSVMWLAILYGMMMLVSYSVLLLSASDQNLDEAAISEYRNNAQISREKMIQCLRLGNYMKGPPHTIEALLFFLQSEYVQAEDTKYGCWQLTGLIVRIAFKMGYHRDGSHFSEISVYESEMRRRIWFILMQFDTASASAVGLPRVIKQVQCDTAEPRSLVDDDFDDMSKILPPARPEHEHTLAQFLIYKSRVIVVYGEICDFTASRQQNDYGEAMRLDDLLNNAYTHKPPVLGLLPIHESIAEGVHLVTRRLYLATSYHHAQITLHRKFTIAAKIDQRYAYSRLTCVNAAIDTLQLQNELFEQCQPGRALHAEQWKILSLIQSEFLLAAIVLCVVLDDEIKNPQAGSPPVSSCEILQRCVTALQVSKCVWTQQRETSKEAQTAVGAITFILRKYQSRIDIDVSSTDTHPVLSTPGASTDIREIGTTVAAPTQSATESKMLRGSDARRSSFAGSSSPNNEPTNPPEEFDPGAWNEFFELDQSWESWMQFDGDSF